MQRFCFSLVLWNFITYYNSIFFCLFLFWSRLQLITFFFLSLIFAFCGFMLLCFLCVCECFVYYFCLLFIFNVLLFYCCSYCWWCCCCCCYSCFWWFCRCYTSNRTPNRVLVRLLLLLNCSRKRDIFYLSNVFFVFVSLLVVVVCDKFAFAWQRRLFPNLEAIVVSFVFFFILVVDDVVVLLVVCCCCCCS